MKTKVDPAWDTALRQAYEEIATAHKVSADTIAETDTLRDLLFDRVTQSVPNANWSKDEMSHRLVTLRKMGKLRSLKALLAAMQTQTPTA